MKKSINDLNEVKVKMMLNSAGSQIATLLYVSFFFIFITLGDCAVLSGALVLFDHATQTQCTYIIVV